MSLDFALEGRTALVTGASRGIGLAIARGLSALGATVHGTSRTVGGARAIADALGTEPIWFDINEIDSHTMLVDGLPAADLLVNNAGVIRPAPALEATTAEYDEVMNTNLRGTFFLTQAFARSWVQRGVQASVVNVSSQTGTVAIEERAIYGASKAAVDNLTKTLALEWASHGIRVNGVAPTWVRTDLAEATLSRAEWAGELLSRIPLGRFGTVDDVAGAVAFLLGDQARMITGHTMLIDGGYTIR